MKLEDRYTINPTLMMGTVKSVNGGQVIINLRGRLGLITIPPKLINSDKPVEAGTKLEFYFSYIRVVDTDLDYDSTEMINQTEMFPCLLGGEVIHEDDTAVRVQIMDHLGTIYVPRRWVFTPVKVAQGLKVEFYFSSMVVHDDNS